MLTTAIIFTVLVAVWGHSGAIAAWARPRRESARSEELATLGLKRR
jgi:hypothetical protein